VGQRGTPGPGGGVPGPALTRGLRSRGADDDASAGASARGQGPPVEAWPRARAVSGAGRAREAPGPSKQSAALDGSQTARAQSAGRPPGERGRGPPCPPSRPRRSGDAGAGAGAAWAGAGPRYGSGLPQSPMAAFPPGPRRREGRPARAVASPGALSQRTGSDPARCARGPVRLAGAGPRAPWPADPCSRGAVQGHCPTSARGGQ
jgi:hypothetical protein